MAQNLREVQNLREIAEQAAKLCAEDLRKAFRGEMVVEEKRDQHDLVSEYDSACETKIVEFLKQADPDARIVGEEHGEQDGAGPVTWHIDPIDGTSNFVQGLAFFCTSIGAEINGKLVAGAVYDPMADNLFSADEDAAYLNGEQLKTPPTLPPGQATLITGYPTAKDLQLDGEASWVDLKKWIRNFSSVRRTGSGALSICHVAAGWTDAAFGTSVSSWDVSAAILILESAGGSYRPLFYPHEGKDMRAATDAPHYAPGYVAVGPGGDYPSLNEAAIRLVNQRLSMHALAL
ncbi:MAG: inositol monophosphatase [Actinomycetaceae bacterium]|nr:inositol monophosphatase [Actinomycetaceae bacterium]